MNGTYSMGERTEYNISVEPEENRSLGRHKL
jgi:hypothetical protein